MIVRPCSQEITNKMTIKTIKPIWSWVTVTDFLKIKSIIASSSNTLKQL